VGIGPSIVIISTEGFMANAYLDVLVDFFVGAQLKDFAAPVVHAAKRVFMDVLGASMRGSEEPENERLAQFAMKNALGGRATSTLLRKGFPLVDEQSAALVNGTQAPSVELDDGYRFATAHSGAHVLPGTLALSEALGKSGAEMLTALVLGYEMASRAAAAVRTPKFVTLGHGLYSALGTAVVAAKLKGFGREQFREAINVAASLGHLAAYRVLKEGATVRNFWNGAGARDGILATDLVEFGFVGLVDGMAASYGLLGPFEPERMLAGLGETYCITQNYHKQYACNGNFDASIESTLRLVSEHALRAEDIRRIRVDIYAPYHTLDVAHPRNTLGAKFSLRYTVAAVAVLRHADHEAFSPDAMANPAVRRLSEATSLFEDPALAARIPLVRPARVTMELADGRVLSTLTENPRGHFENPFTDDELARKFNRPAGRYLTDHGLSRVRGMVLALEDLGSAREFTDAMRAGAATVIRG
jgi:2-methylcitrate dehydratase PrpD